MNKLYACARTYSAVSYVMAYHVTRGGVAKSIAYRDGDSFIEG